MHASADLVVREPLDERALGVPVLATDSLLRQSPLGSDGCCLPEREGCCGRCWSGSPCGPSPFQTPFLEISSSAETKRLADQTCRCAAIRDHCEIFPARWTLTGSVIGAAKLQDTRQTRMTTFLRLAMCGSGERNCALREGRQVPREFRSQISRGNPKG